MSEYLLREATVADAATIARHRYLMFQAMGVIGPDGEAGLVAAMTRYAESELPHGKFRAWLVEHEGQVVAGGALLVSAQAVPYPGFLDEHPSVSIFNVWTDPEHRRQGLAERLMSTMIEWCRAQGIRRLSLNATEDGRRVYERLGFHPGTQMILTLD